jgi:putative endonuclease
MNYVVYILRTSSNTLYTGYTNNLEKRLQEHKSKKRGAKYIRSFRSFTLVYSEAHDSKSAAMKREYQIKQLPKQKKEALIKNAVLTSSVL